MRRGQAIAAALIALAVLGVAALLLTTTRSGLTRAGDTHCPEDSFTTRLDEETGGRACTVVNTDVREVTFGVTVHNTGRFAVTIVDVPLGPLDLVGFTPEAVVEGTPPLRVDSGQRRDLLVRGRLPACESRTTGGATTFTSLALRVRTLGITRGATLPLDPAVRLVAEPC